MRDVVQYARSLTYHTLLEKRDSIERAHRLYDREIKMVDQLFLLEVLSYGELQQYYRQKKLE